MARNSGIVAEGEGRFVDVDASFSHILEEVVYRRREQSHSSLKVNGKEKTNRVAILLEMRVKVANGIEMRWIISFNELQREYSHGMRNDLEMV